LQMFQVHENDHIIEISSKSQIAYAGINLHEGGRIFEVILNDQRIISDQKGFPYSQSSASAIMFPFVNRVQDGKYTFEGKTYQLPINEPAKNNAIHGLLYTQKFELYDTQVSTEHARVTLQYIYDGNTQGFPFPFHFFVTYTLTETTLKVTMKVVNTGTATFPFTIGWHPYFNAENLYEIEIDFNCAVEYTTTDDRSITNGTTPHALKMPFQLKNNQFDTAYQLENSEIQFSTQKYKAIITGNAATNFVQFFTPATENIIAIEPTVGLSNSFNNGIGLQTLASNKTYEIAWTVVIEQR
ncbi:MAG: aldose 1-epimerase, partial [Bacteroidota bacterium]